MASSTVTVLVTSPDTRSERRFDANITINQLKSKLESITGISPSSQKLTLHAQGTEEDGAAPALAVLEDGQKPLVYYGIRDWHVLKVIDANPATASLAGQFTDVSKVEKFEISEEDYAARRDTVLAYKKAHKVGRFAAPQATSQTTETLPIHIALDSRCEVDAVDGGLTRRGTVRFVGPTKFAKGIWAGIEYDEPVGKNDGSIDGERYFTTRPLYGGFVRYDRMRVGDFPVEDLEEDEI